MQLREDIRQTLAGEFSFAAQRMADVPDLQTKLFYFSAFYGALNRALNMEWSDELALVYLVLNSAHQQINSMVMAAATGQRLVGLSKEFPQALTNTCTEIAAMFAADRTDMTTLYPLLSRIAELSYATTGNGRYIYLKGNIKV